MPENEATPASPLEDRISELEMQLASTNARVKRLLLVLDEAVPKNRAGKRLRWNGTAWVELPMQVVRSLTHLVKWAKHKET